jgi:hypothetical protein
MQMKKRSGEEDEIGRELSQMYTFNKAITPREMTSST